MIFDAATKTKGSAGQSRMDTELYRRILCSKNFKVEGKAFHKKSVKARSLPIFAGRLYLLQTHPLGQKPWNTTYWRWCGTEANSRTTNARFLKKEIKEAAGPIQVCAGHSAGSETAIHAMSQVFVKEGDRTELKVRYTLTTENFWHGSGENGTGPQKKGSARIKFAV